MLATWSLSAISLAAGWLLGWGFLRLSNRRALATATNRLRAHLMELRLFADEPALVWIAQWDLVKANGVFLWCMLRPLAVLALPAALLMWQMEPFYARAPLRPGESTLVTWEAPHPAASTPVLQSAEGIQVETPSVRWNGNRNATWRLRAQQAGLAHLPLHGEGFKEEAEVVAGDSFVRLPRSQALGNAELRVDYPQREFALFGWSMGWSAWFLLWSSVAAMAAVWWLR